jgi:hypothetical protein
MIYKTKGMLGSWYPLGRVPYAAYINTLGVDRIKPRPLKSWLQVSSKRYHLNENADTPSVNKFIWLRNVQTKCSSQNHKVNQLQNSYA